jgi:phosphonate transport system substrate-binding protein
MLSYRSRSRLLVNPMLLLVLTLSCAPALSACGSDKPSTGAATSTTGAAGAATPANRSKLTIAVLPTNTPENLANDAKELDQFLSARLGREVDLIFPTNYAGVIEALRFGHAQAAFMSAWPLALAQKHAGAEVALAEVREVVIGQNKVEEPYYFSYWVVRPDSPITSLEQLRGKRVAFPSTLSTSGYVAPLARLVELGLVPSDGKKEADPKSFFGDVVFAGGYAQGWEALKAGRVDAAIIAGDVPEALYREVLANTRVIDQQGPVPSHGVAFARQLDAADRAQLKEALLALNAPENRALMRKFISGIFVGFKPTTGEEHLGSLNRYLDATGLEYVERLR